VDIKKLRGRHEFPIYIKGVFITTIHKVRELKQNKAWEYAKKPPAFHLIIINNGTVCVGIFVSGVDLLI